MDDLLSLLAVPAQESGGERSSPSKTTAPRRYLPPHNARTPTSVRRRGRLNPFGSTEPSGEHFIVWLQQGIQARRLIINDAKALVHTVADTAYLVSPGVFQRYAQEHPSIAALAKQDKVQDWQWIQKRFEKLQLHRKQASGLNIWTCEVTAEKIPPPSWVPSDDAGLLFSETPPNNPYLSLSDDTTNISL